MSSTNTDAALLDFITSSIAYREDQQSVDNTRASQLIQYSQAMTVKTTEYERRLAEFAAHKEELEAMVEELSTVVDDSEPPTARPLSNAVRQLFTDSEFGKQYISLCRLRGFPETESSLYLMAADVDTTRVYAHPRLRTAHDRACLTNATKVCRVGETTRGHPRAREHVIYEGQTDIVFVVPVRGVQTKYAEAVCRKYMRARSSSFDGEWGGLVQDDIDILQDIMAFISLETPSTRSTEEVDSMWECLPPSKRARLIKFSA